MNIYGSTDLTFFELFSLHIDGVLHHPLTSVLQICCMCRGSFGVCRSGQTFDSWDGIQAHLSTCASPKVMEAVNKFKSRIVLYEVPRLSTWPVQFQENGVREDDIALFFFAKDLER